MILLYPYSRSAYTDSVSSSLVETRGDKCWLSTTDEGTRELCGFPFREMTVHSDSLIGLPCLIHANSLVLSERLHVIGMA